MQGETNTTEGEGHGEGVELQTAAHTVPSTSVTGSLAPTSGERESVIPCRCAVLITKYPAAVCCCSWIIIIICAALSATTFRVSLTANRQYWIDSDPYVQRRDAINLAREDAAKTSSAKIKQNPQSQLDFGFSWTLYFRDPGTDFLLTKSNIEIILKYEQQITNPKEYKEYCFAPAAPANNYNCLPLNSNIPVQSMAYEIKNHPNYTTWTDADIKNYVRSQAKSPTRGKAVLPSFNKEYNDTGKLWFYRTQIFMGAPIPTTNVTSMTNRGSKYGNRGDNYEEQEATYVKWATPLFRDITANQRGQRKEGGMQIVAWTFSVFLTEILFLLNESIVLGFLAMCFVLCYIWFHTESFFLACSGMTQVLMSFPVAFVIYRYIYQIKFVGFLHLLIIFVILGLGADDIFVLVDAFHQSEHIVEHPDDLQERMSYTYRRASIAMLVTQATTFFAFMATASSVVMPMATFGIWASTVVLCNYLLVVTMFVAALVLWQNYVRPNECFCGCCCGCCGPCKGQSIRSLRKTTQQQTNPEVPRERVGDDGATDGGRSSVAPPVTLQRTTSVQEVAQEYRPIERFFGMTWVKNIDRFRYYILGIFVVIFGVGIFGLTQLRAQSESQGFVVDSHYFHSVLNVWPNEFYRGENDAINTLDFYWGVNGVDRAGTDRFDPEVYGKVVLDGGFDMSSPGAQQFMLYACIELRKSPLMFQGFPKSKEKEKVDCFIEPFITWLQASPRNLTFPYVASQGQNQKNNFYKLVYEFVTANPKWASNVDARKSGNTYELRYVVYKCKMRLGVFAVSNPVKYDERQQWEDLLTNIKTQCVARKNATGVCNPNFIDDGGNFLFLASSRAFVTSAFQGIAIALPLAFVVLIFATHNVVIALMSILDIGGVMITALALIPAFGWKFGITESVAVIMIIGFSVDYVVHLGHAYIESPIEGRIERLRYAMLTMGVSVLSGGLTTFGAGLFLLPSIWLIFFQMGVILICTIALSLMFAFFFFTSLVAVVGPENGFGSVPVDKYCCFWCPDDVCGDRREHNEKKEKDVEIR